MLELQNYTGQLFNSNQTQWLLEKIFLQKARAHCQMLNNNSHKASAVNVQVENRYISIILPPQQLNEHSSAMSQNNTNFLPLSMFFALTEREKNYTKLLGILTFHIIFSIMQVALKNVIAILTKDALFLQLYICSNCDPSKRLIQPRIRVTLYSTI